MPLRSLASSALFSMMAGLKTVARSVPDWATGGSIRPSLTENFLAKGMEFGLWLEPKMVNPDSDLYRAHPDWVLHANPAPVLLARNQLVLDLSRPEEQDDLFERVDTLLAEYPITYLKWDMNRTISQPGDCLGRAAGHRKTLALYQLMARIRSAHPRVKI